MTSTKKRIYVDSSVIGIVADEDNRRLHTQAFWDAVRRGEITVIVSDVLDDELENAPPHIRDFFDSIPEAHIERVESTDKSDSLAKQYIAEKVVGQASLDDCRHIAVATLCRADVLVSWNFRHIVNINRIRGYNSVNEKLGYPRIEIRPPYPYEVIHDET
jgi:hypothetical protein